MPNTEQPTQPTAAAMRAARILAVSKPLIDAIHTGVGQYGIAQIIDRETQADLAELREALEAMVNSIAPDLEYAITEAIRHGKRVTTYTQAKIDALDKARAVLARHPKGQS